MNSKQREQREMEKLLSCLVNGTLGQRDASRLEQLLLGNPERQQFYKQYMELDVLLEAEAAVPYEECVQAGDCPPSGKRPAESAGKKSLPALVQREEPSTLGAGGAGGRALNRLNFSLGKQWYAVAALLAVTAGAILGVRLTGGFDPEFQVIGSLSVAGGDQAKLPDVGDSLTFGETYSLQSGVMRLKTGTGVLVAVEGPAEFQPQSSDCLSLTTGKARVRVPSEARGFVLQGRGTKITDLGTEFGVDISSDGYVKTEVYEGCVLLELSDQQEVGPIEISEGWAGESRSGANPLLGVHPIGRHTKPISWWSSSQRYVSEVLAADPEYYCRFDQVHGSVSDSLINSELYGAVLSGDARAVELGADTALGMPGHALRFSGEGEAEIPLGMAAVEQTGAYSFALWVRLDSLADQNILVATNHLGPHRMYGPQLRVRKDGTVEHYLYSKGQRGKSGDKYTQSSETRLMAGQWHQLAVSASTNGEMQLYIDGKQAAPAVAIHSQVTGEYPRILIAASSGLKQGGGSYMGRFVGYVDELAFFNHALSSAQIAQFYQASRPLFFRESNR